MASLGIGDGARENPLGAPFQSRYYAQPLNAAALASFQADVFEALGSSSTRFSARAVARVEDGQARLDTKSASGQVDTHLLKTDSTRSGGNIFAPSYLTDLEIVSSEKGSVKQGRMVVKRQFNKLNEIVDPGTGRLEILELDAKGRTVMSFEPAVTKPRLNEFNEWLRDPGGRAMRSTHPAGERTNCRVPYSGRSECNYIVRFANQRTAAGLGTAGGAVALELTIDERRGGRLNNQDALDINGVVRTLDGKRTLALIRQKVGLDENGKVRIVQTDAELLTRRK